MPKESYASRLERINRLTKKRDERNVTRSELAQEVGMSTQKIRDIERGVEVTGGEAKEICGALGTRWSEIWVKQDGMIVVREKKSTGSSAGCYCKL